MTPTGAVEPSPDVAALLRTAWARVPAGAGRRGVAWRLLRDLLGDVEIANPCPFCGGPHGPVQLPRSPWVASVSYAGGLAVAATLPADAAPALGIDAVASGPASSPPVVSEGPNSGGFSEMRMGRVGVGLERVLGPSATPRDWARVEAVLKADGRGLRLDPAAVRVRETDAGWAADLPDGSSMAGWDPPGPDGVVLAAAIRRRPPPRPPGHPGILSPQTLQKPVRATGSSWRG